MPRFFETSGKPTFGQWPNWWISSLRPSRASRSPLQGKGEERLTNAISGQTPLESFGKWDQGSSCWRTYQVSLWHLDTLEPWSENWLKQGMIVSGVAYRLRPLAPRISVGGGGVWPTPDSNTSSYAGKGYGLNLRQAVQNRHTPDLPTQVGGQLNPRWVEWLMGLPIGWTALEPLATESYLQWLKSFCDDVGVHSAIQYWRGGDGPGEPIAGPVRLELEFYLLPPKKPTNEYPRQDNTNLIKACEDALQGIVFVNDSQVVVTRAKKAYATKDSNAGFTVIRVEQLTD